MDSLPSGPKGNAKPVATLRIVFGASTGCRVVRLTWTVDTQVLVYSHECRPPLRTLPEFFTHAYFTGFAFLFYILLYIPKLTWS